jgi:hypothetical protein
MRVDIEKGYVDCYKKIIREANKRKSSLKSKKGKYEKALFRKDLSIENKKKELANNLHELVISTLSVNAKKVNNKALSKFKENIPLMRVIIYKIKSINNYLEESFLRDLGIIKKSLIVKAIKSKNPVKYLEKTGKVLSKKDIGRIEHAVYELMQEIIFFDKKILKDYKKKEVKVIGAEKLGIKDLEKILKAQSELLDALEAKIPPGKKVKAKLFGKEVFNKWVPMVFALLSGFEAEYEKEKLIFSKIKKNDRLRKRIENKIKHVVNEKESVLKIKEKRALAMKSFKVSDDYRQTLHEYVSAASL